ncbi:DUF7718 family protein [Devriesea agamarum]|uniref:DUF7718 family protein n=1 Tax=Devriesea agamarum TaxID=472569 RepID=UPI00071CB0D3|nr:hypothetical protein [Devriesea agamarum]
MTAKPKPEQYTPPPQAACTVETTLVDIGDHLQIEIVQHIYRGKVVRFAIMLYYDDGSERLAEVSRIDTCHGAVHRHRMREGIGDTGETDIIQYIHVDGTEWDVVNSMYDYALDQMFDHAHEYFRRWKQ